MFFNLWCCYHEDDLNIMKCVCCVQKDRGEGLYIRYSHCGGNESTPIAGNVRISAFMNVVNRYASLSFLLFKFNVMSSLLSV